MVAGPLKNVSPAGDGTVFAQSAGVKLTRLYGNERSIERENEDGSTTLQNGRLEMFRNFDEHGNRLPIPRTLLIDSQQLESRDKLSDDFRRAAADLIERFRRERVERSGNPEAADSISDQELLREVTNTVGKEGRLGGEIRCVVSVSMLTEGWDANTVTHVLGVRAFGTQLLCEQVVGRALRRQSYDLNEDNKFNVEYADVLGIPFDFTARPVVVGPGTRRKTVHVTAVRPDRDHLEITFPRVTGLPAGSAQGGPGRQLHRGVEAASESHPCRSNAYES